MKGLFNARHLGHAVLLGLLTLAGATSAPRLTLAQQAVKADVIVRATVQAPTSVQENGQTWTVYPLTVLETLAGDAQSLPKSQDSPSVWVLGGLQDGPLLTGGETMLLLYKSRYDSPLVGFNQGFYPVQGTGSSKVVLNLPDGTPGVTPVAPIANGSAAPAAASTTAPAVPAVAAPTDAVPAASTPAPTTLPNVSPPNAAQPASTTPSSAPSTPVQPSPAQPNPAVPVTPPASSATAAPTTPPAAGDPAAHRPRRIGLCLGVICCARRTDSSGGPGRYCPHRTGFVRARSG